MTTPTLPLHDPRMSEAHYHCEADDTPEWIKSFVGSSTLKRLDKYVPAKAIVPMVATPQMDLGSIFHECVRDGRVQGRYAVVTDGRTKEGKRAKAEAESEGIPVVNSATDITLRGMIDSCRAHPWVAQMLARDDIREEESVFAEIEGVLCKARSDIAVPSAPFTVDMVDWKTARDVSVGGFERAMDNLSYPIQEAHYRAVWEAATGESVQNFYWVAVESEPPYLTAVYQLTPAWRAEGVARWLAALRLYNECSKINVWPAMPDEPVQLGGPKWAYKITHPVDPMINNMKG